MELSFYKLMLLETNFHFIWYSLSRDNGKQLRSVVTVVRSLSILEYYCRGKNLSITKSIPYNYIFRIVLRDKFLVLTFCFIASSKWYFLSFANEDYICNDWLSAMFRNQPKELSCLDFDLLLSSVSL